MTQTTTSKSSQPGQPSQLGTFGPHHVAYPCWNPAETLRLYRDVLGFPMPHAITAKGWGQEGHPDFVHFFFDTGNGSLLAFFSYLGWQPPTPRHPVLERASHIAFRVEDETALLGVHDRLVQAGYTPTKVLKHEILESVYLTDPNDLMIEFTRDLRPATTADAEDARVTMDALIEAVAAGETTIEEVWRRKAAVAGANKTAIYVVDVPEYQSLIEWARTKEGQGEGLQVVKQGNYQVIKSKGPIEFTRAETGLRAALWFSLATGGLEGRITRHDWNGFKLEPAI
jgi:catechol 2,3-dioxygenase-like lactoylglutathione lyase family enzyme